MRKLKPQKSRFGMNLQNRRKHLMDPEPNFIIIKRTGSLVF